MLLAKSSVLLKPSAPLDQFSCKKCPNKTKAKLFGTYEKNMLRSSRSASVGKLEAVYNGYPYFTAPYHPLQAQLPFQMELESQCEGIGIHKFFQGKNIFITGATGLLGKALIEKLLRSTCVGKIYILVKARDKEAAFERMSKEIIGSELFECLREKHGSSYEEFARKKLIPVVGNICEPNIGMDAYSANKIMEDVDVIIESAASTTLNDRYDYLLDINVSAPQRLMRFAKKCKNLKLFVHISTAYVNGRKEGVIYEKPLIMGENGRKQDDDETSSSLFPLDLADEMSLAMKTCITSANCDVNRYMKRLGHERAAYYGWYNAYHMTKAMGEMALNEIREEVPVLIMRPSVIESCFKEPIPGWIQGNRMYDPVIASYGKGLLPAYLADPNLHTDIVPVDMVANTTIAAIAKHGAVNRTHELNVYHVATDYVNPLLFSDMFNYMYQHFTANPLSDLETIPKMKFFSEFNDFSKYTRDEIAKHNALLVNGRTHEKIQKLYKARVAYAEQLCKMYEFIGFFQARFHTGNTRKLLEEMSKEEQDEFEVDAAKIDWRKYFAEIHIPGLRKHVLNETNMTV